MKTVILNLNTGEETTYINEFPPIDNLVQHAIVEKHGASQLYNELLKAFYYDSVVEGEKTLSVGEFCCFKSFDSGE